MKTLNDYGKDVMDAQSRAEAIAANIEKTQAALESLKADQGAALDALEKARADLQEATDRVKAGDYGADAADEATAIEAVLNDDTPFEGINRSPPGDDPDFQFPDNRTLASNGAGF